LTEARAAMSDEENAIDPPPDLQEWICRYGGYPNIPWDQWDRAVADWRARHRARLQRELEIARPSRRPA